MVRRQGTAAHDVPSRKRGLDGGDSNSPGAAAMAVAPDRLPGGRPPLLSPGAREVHSHRLPIRHE
ncbi:hypothetical protein D187_002351 [Cystobacter fuscus DSM 2262]|uniref:Uncharacterized protein n=1 Tax=Cystobacter fuscus (strain ATCC 25194 / DSM 2262 / NBRC 100088 / M29) TaxID=1242864 RepID=S9P731_CYSF2|nr:hypothetical protein D187_002351 [Cystobacter fuscus DSM 2262]